MLLMGGLETALEGFLPWELGGCGHWDPQECWLCQAPSVLTFPMPVLGHPRAGDHMLHPQQPLPGRTNPNPLDPMSNPPTQVPNNGADSANKKSITIYSIQLFHTYSTGSASALLGAARTVLSN